MSRWPRYLDDTIDSQIINHRSVCVPPSVISDSADPRADVACGRLRRMRPHASRFVVCAVGVVVLAAAGVATQAPPAPGPPANIAALKNFLPLGPPAGLKPSAVPDLSGAWVRGGP